MRSPVGFASILAMTMTMTHIHMASAIKYAAHCKLEEFSAITVEWDQGQQFFFEAPETSPNIFENDPKTDSGNNRHLRGSVNGSAERSLQVDSTKQNRAKYKALNCSCVNGTTRPAALCIAKENYDKRLAMCSVPSDLNLPVECLTTTNGEIFARNAWPITLLWLTAIIIYAFITEGGRLGLKYMFSCCCFFWCKNISNSHRDFIEEIIRREADTRRRFQRVAVARQNSGRDGPSNRDSSSGPITYILKTKQYMSDKKKVVDSESTTSENTAPLSPENSQDSDENPTTKDTINEPLSPESTGIQQDSDQNPTPALKHTENVDITNELLCRPCGDVEGDIGGESNGNADIYANLDFSDEEFDEDAVVCTICIMEIEDGDRIGALPCEHQFHVDCLKEWIKRKNVCPLCQCPDIAREKGSPLVSSTADESNDNEREDEDEDELHNSPTVRTTGARVDPDEVTSSGRRRRRRRMMNSNGGNTNVSRRLFQVNGRARSTVRVNARNSASVNNSGTGSSARQASILVGDPASNGNSGNRRIETNLASIRVTNAPIPRLSSTASSIMVTRRAANRQRLEERRERMLSLRARSGR